VVEENNINANVSILRKALGEDANGQSYIETGPRVGYRFVAKVRQVALPQSAQTTNGGVAPEPEQAKSVVLTDVNLRRGSWWATLRSRRGLTRPLVSGSLR
jgi:DNA-binding winged helix-turn-helix (wHTH) protein